jgi:3-oxoacyl-[acyl-carrier protein] reductase
LHGLDNKVAVVTGGARGIGKEIALRLAGAGCRLVISDVDLAGAEAAAAEIRQIPGESIAVQTNVSQQGDAAKLVEATIEKFGRIDILVNNAGITRDNLLMRMDESEWDSVIAVNLKGTFNCIKAVVRPMIKQRSGKIINVASVVGIMGNAGQANYAASKAGIIGLTKSVAKELGSRNIQVNAIAPGYIETEMTKNLPQAAIEQFLSAIPLQKAGQPADVANVVLFLAGSLSDYVTGQVIQVDGGMLM